MASTAALQLLVELDDRASKGLQGIADKGSILHNALGFVAGGAISGGISALGSAVVGFFENASAQTDQWNSGLSQLDAVLKSTGGSAGVTKDQVTGLANSLSAGSGLSKFADDAVLSGENLLLTFTNVGKDTFPAATQAMLDMSQALGQDMGSSAIQLGKALNDPVKGITALQRVGVSFTAAQKEQIDAMVKAGDTMGAQKVILAELGKEFGGSALAGTKSFSGEMVVLQEKFNNVAQTVGDKLAPILEQVIGWLSQPSTMGAIQGLADMLTGSLARSFQLVSDVLAVVLPIIQQIAAPFEQFFATLSAGESPMTAFTDLISNLGAVVGPMVGGLIQAIGDALPGIVTQLGTWAGAFLAWVAPMIVPFLTEVGKVILALLQWVSDQIPGIVAQLATWAAAFIAWIGPMIPTFLGEMGKLLLDLGTWFVGTALPAIVTSLLQWSGAFIAWIAPMIPPFLLEMGKLLLDLGTWLLTVALPAIVTKLAEWGAAFIGWVGKDVLPNLGPALGNIATAVWNFITQTALPTIAAKLIEWGTAFIAWVGPMLLQLPTTLGNIATAVWNFITQTALPTIITNLAQWASAFLSWVAGVITGLPAALGTIATAIWGWITSAAKDLASKASSIGTSIIDGIKAGLQATWDGLVGKLRGLIDMLPQVVKDLLGIKSPSSVFASLAENIPLGIAQGIQGAWGAVDSALRGGVQSSIDAAQGMLASASLTAKVGGTLGAVGAGAGSAGIASLPIAAFAGLGSSSNNSIGAINITVNAGAGANGPDIAQAVMSSLSQGLESRSQLRMRPAARGSR